MGIAFASSPDEAHYRDRPKAVFDLGLADLEMGLVNDAEHMAHEALAVQGPHPTILRQLVLANLVKRRPKVAAVFLRALCLDPVARPWAEARLAILTQTPEALLESEDVAGMRRNIPSRRDLQTALRSLEESCLAQLEENPQDRMAFEPPAGQQLEPAGDRPRLHPRIHGVTIPPNLCPLTFVVDEPGVWYSVRVESASGEAYRTAGRDPRVRIPSRSWGALLRGSGGGDVTIRINVRDATGAWRAFAPVCLHVSGDPIDGFLAYRRTLPLYNFWRDVGVYQRALTGWQERAVLQGRDFSHGCTNCHAFARASPATMTIGTRSQDHGSATLLCRDGVVTKLASKWGYTSWHPSGKAAAYRVPRRAGLSGLPVTCHRSGRGPPCPKALSLARMRTRDGSHPDASAPGRAWGKRLPPPHGHSTT